MTGEDRDLTKDMKDVGSAYARFTAALTVLLVEAAAHKPHTRWPAPVRSALALLGSGWRFSFHWTRPGVKHWAWRSPPKSTGNGRLYKTTHRAIAALRKFRRRP